MARVFKGMRPVEQNGINEQGYSKFLSQYFSNFQFGIHDLFSEKEYAEFCELEVMDPLTATNGSRLGAETIGLLSFMALGLTNKTLDEFSKDVSPEEKRKIGRQILDFAKAHPVGPKVAPEVHSKNMRLWANHIISGMEKFLEEKPPILDLDNLQNTPKESIKKIEQMRAMSMAMSNLLGRFEHDREALKHIGADRYEYLSIRMATSSLLTDTQRLLLQDPNKMETKALTFAMKNFGADKFNALCSKPLKDFSADVFAEFGPYCFMKVFLLPDVASGNELTPEILAKNLPDGKSAYNATISGQVESAEKVRDELSKNSLKEFMQDHEFSVIYDEDGISHNLDYLKLIPKIKTFYVPNATGEATKYEVTENSSNEVVIQWKPNEGRGIESYDLNVAKDLVDDIYKKIDSKEVDPALVRSSTEFRNFKQNLSQLKTQLDQFAKQSPLSNEQNKTLADLLESTMQLGDTYLTKKTREANLSPLAERRIDAVTSALKGLTQLKQCALGYPSLVPDATAASRGLHEMDRYICSTLRDESPYYSAEAAALKEIRKAVAHPEEYNAPEKTGKLRAAAVMLIGSNAIKNNPAAKKQGLSVLHVKFKEQAAQGYMDALKENYPDNKIGELIEKLKSEKCLDDLNAQCLKTIGRTVHAEHASVVKEAKQAEGPKAGV